MSCVLRTNCITAKLSLLWRGTNPFPISILRICPSLPPVSSYKQFLLLSFPAPLPPVLCCPESPAPASGWSQSQCTKQAQKLWGIPAIRRCESNKWRFYDKEWETSLALRHIPVLQESLPVKVPHVCFTQASLQGRPGMVLGRKWGRNRKVCNQNVPEQPSIAGQDTSPCSPESFLNEAVVSLYKLPQLCCGPGGPGLAG